LCALELRQENLEKKLYSILEDSRRILEQILGRLNIPECEITRLEV
jgi:hypothetical protein